MSEYLHNRHVEAERGKGSAVRLRLHTVVRGIPIDKIDHAMVLDQHPFGFTVDPEVNIA